MKLSLDLIANSTSFLNTNGRRELDLRSNKITAIENLGVTRDHNAVLDMTLNEIRRLDNFPSMPGLRELYLGHNRITVIDASLGVFLPNLEVLVLSHNSLTEFTDLLPLKALSHLKILVLTGNPVCDRKAYRLFVIQALPQVRYLDFSHVRDTERQQAKELYETSTEFEVGQIGAAGGQKKMSEEEVEKIRVAIRNAKTLEEVSLLERRLRQGQSV
jgi:U2 small nuclear ribonucleoprotein A'